MGQHTENVHGKEIFCPIESCNEKFNSRHELSKHKKKHKKSHKCDECNSSFPEEKYLLRHKAKFHEGAQVAKNFCLQCELQFQNWGESQNHINNKHTTKSKFELMDSAYNYKHQDWCMTLGKQSNFSLCKIMK